MPVVETHYAEALLNAASSAGLDDKAAATLSDFSDILINHEELQYFLFNPVLSAEIKKDTINKILGDSAEPVLVNFFSLLADKDRLELLPEIIREYGRLKNLYRNNLEINVYSAEALAEDQLSAIREKYRKQYGASSATVNNHVDPSLLGGVRVKIGDTCIDDTLFGRLKGLLSVIS